MAVIHTLGDLGALVRLFREDLGLSQDQLAKAASVPRTAVAHLEQRHRLPAADHLKALAKFLKFPNGLVDPFLRPAAARRVEFEAELGELVGHDVSIADLDTEAAIAVEGAIGALMGNTLTNQQAYDTLREIQVFYGISPVSRKFFERYFKADSFQDLDQLSAAVRLYQSEAIRLFPTFSQAYTEMNRGDLDALVASLGKRSLDEYRDRAPWERVQNIDEENLRDLVYYPGESSCRAKVSMPRWRGVA